MGYMELPLVHTALGGLCAAHGAGQRLWPAILPDWAAVEEKQWCWAAAPFEAQSMMLARLQLCRWCQKMPNPQYLHPACMSMLRLHASASSSGAQR